ncbi:methyltransferase family protein [Sphingomonas sp. GlSt437]|uniref:methyltransferase family protein n=1 Tax=Sphingomonas sp. GlSt437 TaxID=3389970 RepID=UPI003A8C6EAA
MHWLMTPVGPPGLIALGVGGVLWIVAFFAARRRVTAAGPDSGGRRASASWLWIAVQGLGIGAAGFGPIAVQPDDWSTGALIRGAVVLALMLATIGLFDWSSRTMGKNWALVARTRGDANLVTTGPFAIVRNPIYVALFLFMWAMAIAYGHLANLIVGVPLYVIGTVLRVQLEEQVLRAEFGAAYDAYAARVKRFIPGVL